MGTPEGVKLGVYDGLLDAVIEGATVGNEVGFDVGDLVGFGVKIVLNDGENDGIMPWAVVISERHKRQAIAAATVFVFEDIRRIVMMTRQKIKNFWM